MTTYTSLLNTVGSRYRHLEETQMLFFVGTFLCCRLDLNLALRETTYGRKGIELPVVLFF